MAYNGSGQFLRLFLWAADKLANVKIRADRMDSEMDGFAAGLSNAICRDGQSTITDDIPFNNKRITGLGNATDAADAVSQQFGDTRYVLATAATMPPGYIYGLTLSNNVADATNDIDIAAGSCTNSTNASDLVLAAALTKRLDGSWAVGTGNGGLDTGSIANAWYNVFLIKRVDTNVVDALFSISATAPTLPTDYTLFRRIGSVFRTGGVLKPFTQLGKQFLWKTAPVLDWNAVSPGTSPGTNYVLSVPPGVQVNADIRALWIGGSLSYNKVRSPDVTASVASSSDFDCATDAVTTIATTPLSVRTNTSAQVFASTTTALTTVSIVTAGWCEI